MEETKTISLRESIRTRPGMYLGHLGFRGVLNLLKYLLDELIEETEENASIHFELNPGNAIGLIANNIKTPRYENMLASLDKPRHDYFIGLRVAIELSAKFEMCLTTDKTSVTLKANRGEHTISVANIDKQKNSIHINFSPDETIFKLDHELNYEHFASFLKKFAYLNPGLRILISDKRKDYQHNILHYPLGIKHLMDNYIHDLEFYCEPKYRLDLQKTIGKYSYQFSFFYSYVYYRKSFIRSFANTEETHMGGSLVDGFLDGVMKAVKETAGDIPLKNITKKLAKESLTLIAAVKGQNFRYKGATKSNLDVPRIRKEVKDYIYEALLARFASDENMKKDVLEYFRRLEY